MKNRKIGASGLLLAGAMAVCMASQAFGYGIEPFDQLEEQIFHFSSGAGGWGTHLWIGGDGSFWGNYHDSDMGDTGEGYPFGTVYVSDFVGMFSDPVKIDEYTYQIHVDEVETLKTPGEPDRILGEIRYVYSEPYGVQGGEDYLLFLPGKPVSELPEGYLRWLNRPEEGYDCLDGFGLYWEKGEDENVGFFGFPMTPEEGSQWEALLEAVWDEGKPLYDELSKDLAQQPMNIAVGQLYRAWDKCLNDMWAYLGSILSQEAMEALTEEELVWIEDKEAKVSEAGAMYQGGSLQPFVEGSTAASLTRQRVYELWNAYQFYDPEVAAGEEE